LTIYDKVTHHTVAGHIIFTEARWQKISDFLKLDNDDVDMVIYNILYLQKHAETTIREMTKHSLRYRNLKNLWVCMAQTNMPVFRCY